MHPKSTTYTLEVTNRDGSTSLASFTDKQSLHDALNAAKASRYVATCHYHYDMERIMHPDLYIVRKMLIISGLLLGVSAVLGAIAIWAPS